MPYQRQKLLALITIDPKAAKKEILDAFREAKANRIDTAKALGCHHHTLTRWCEELGIREELDKLEKKALKEGWHHGKNRQGRPRKTEAA